MTPNFCMIFFGLPSWLIWSNKDTISVIKFSQLKSDYNSDTIIINNNELIKV